MAGVGDGGGEETARGAGHAGEEDGVLDPEEGGEGGGDGSGFGGHCWMLVFV
jgi:hypothetical protein